MLKIYPSPFNKFAVFILYGLLSVAVITLAQSGQTATENLPNGCPLTPYSSPTHNGKIIGYLHLDSTNNTDTIPWNSYDYINVIAYPKIEGTPWNDFKPPGNLNSLKEFVTKAKTKVLLSISNFNLEDFPNNPKDYSDITNQTLKTIDETGVDGIDIEYPGMRGRYCKRPDNSLYWNTGDDNDFVDFIKGLHDRLRPLKKTLMLTVGIDSINGLNDSHIDFLNIEAYHNSFYENLKNPLADSVNFIRTYPNAPYIVFENAYNAWNNRINDTKIIMGVDLGNTLQIVDSQDIKTNQITVSGKYPKAIPPFDQRINFCPGSDNLIVKTFAWNQLADTFSSSDNCNNFKGWERNFDPVTFTPWLTKSNSDQPSLPLGGGSGSPNQGDQRQIFDYLSYEDFVSINKKLSFVVDNSIGGISISDISYDDEDEKVSLVNFIQGIRQQTPASNPTNKGNGTSGDNSTVSPSTSPTNSGSTDSRDVKPGVIAGAVVGSILGLVFISGIAFLGFRYKDRLPFGQNKYNKDTMYNYTGTHMNQPGMIPDGSPRMIIPDTTAIPVAPSYVTAMFDFAGKEENDLSFKKGDKIEVLERGDGPNDWWVGKVNGAVGEFPGNYVKE